MEKFKFSKEELQNVFLGIGCFIAFMLFDILLFFNNGLFYCIFIGLAIISLAVSFYYLYTGLRSYREYNKKSRKWHKDRYSSGEKTTYNLILTLSIVSLALTFICLILSIIATANEGDFEFFEKGMLIFYILAIVLTILFAIYQKKIDKEVEMREQWRKQEFEKKRKNENNIIAHADEILKLKELLDCGALTQEEFDEQKKQLLRL